MSVNARLKDARRAQQPSETQKDAAMEPLQATSQTEVQGQAEAEHTNTGASGGAERTSADGGGCLKTEGSTLASAACPLASPACFRSRIAACVASSAAAAGGGGGGAARDGSRGGEPPNG